MRELIFRGKRIDTGKWIVSDSILQLPSGEVQLYDEVDEKWWDVNTDTVGQFTSLTDENGVNIFEGDIVKRYYWLHHGETKKTRETQIGVVSYSNKDCGFHLEKACFLRKPWKGDTLEIIGNKYDNGDLL